jgi:hypothetical protein
MTHNPIDVAQDRDKFKLSPSSCTVQRRKHSTCYSGTTRITNIEHTRGRVWMGFTVVPIYHDEFGESPKGILQCTTTTELRMTVNVLLAFEHCRSKVECYYL